LKNIKIKKTLPRASDKRKQKTYQAPVAQAQAHAPISFAGARQTPVIASTSVARAMVHGPPVQYDRKDKLAPIVDESWITLMMKTRATNTQLV